MFGKSRYSTGYADYPGVGRITDGMIAKFIRQHTHWWDRLDYHKISDASQLAFLMLAKVVKMPTKKKWYF